MAVWSRTLVARNFGFHSPRVRGREHLRHHPARPGHHNHLFSLITARTTRGRTPVLHRWTSLTAFSALVGLCVAAPAAAQAPAWTTADLLAAAKAEGNAMTVYGSMNEQEALPYYKMFEDATGIKVTYVRASDTALVSRILLE